MNILSNSIRVSVCVQVCLGGGGEREPVHVTLKRFYVAVGSQILHCWKFAQP